jgi:gliding motility-associated-like protein
MNLTLLPFQKLIIVLLMLIAVSVLQGQTLSVTSGNTLPYTPQNLISNVFLGDGVTVTNIVYKGKPAAVGYFNGGTSAIGLERGIVMTTGIAESNNSGIGAEQTGDEFASEDNFSTATDGDLDNLTTADTKNVAVYIITFIPTADTLRFRYCFASEEYPEYGCSDYNDVFGFFIQGPGYPIQTNIAKIPGTNLPVTINNIHPQNPGNAQCTPAYEQFYNDNNNSNIQPTYDGFTNVFTATAIVQPCQTYTLKLAIADVSDEIYDSGVFLEAKSFGTGSLQVEAATASNDGTVTEGCAEGMLRFMLPTPATEDFIIDYNIWGTATNGVDLVSIPMDLIIPYGETEVSVPITAFEDNLTEGTEYLAIDIQKDICTRDTIYIYIRDNTIMPPNLRPDTSLCVAGVGPITLNGTLPVAIPAAPSFSNMNDFTIAPVNSSVFSNINVFGVQPTILDSGVIRSVCFNATHGWVDDLDIFLVSPGGQFIPLSTDNGANGDNYTQTCFTPSATTKISFPGPFAPASAAPFTGDWLPEGVWSDLWDGNFKSNGTWKLQVIDDSNGSVGTLNDWTITFEPSYKLNYEWSPTATVSCADCPITIASPSETTTYHVTATDSYGCVVQDSVTIEVTQTLAAPIIDCSDISANNITFVWDPILNAQGYEINVDGAGWQPITAQNYIVTGLVPSTNVTIEVRGTAPNLDCPPLIGSETCTTCNAPMVQFSAVGVSCFGASNGTVAFTTDNINPPYTFKVGTQSNTTGSFTGLAAGNYSVSVSDALGCEMVKPFTIATPDALTASANIVSPITCFGLSNAKATVANTGGTAPFTYKWSDAAGQTTQIANNLGAGLYTVTVTDANGCSKTSTLSIAAPQALLAGVLNVNGATCFEQANGSATASAAGGTLPYTYTWSNGSTNIIANNLVAGTYGLTITDANLCTKTSSAIITQPTAITATTTSESTSCNGGQDGKATVLPTGGTPTYSFAWNNGISQTTANVIGLTSQNYIVTITDTKGCTLTKTITVDEPSAIIVTANVTDALCFGSSTGTANAQATGGTGAFAYKWNSTPVQNNASAQNLPLGNYIVTATDANGCFNTTSISISEPAAITINAVVLDAKCNGNSDGKITITSNGGTSPYSYAWNSGETIQNLNSKPAGDYEVTLTDANGCTEILAKTIAEPDQIEAVLSTLSVKCYGESSGQISIVPTGGVGSFNSTWKGPNNYNGSGNNIQNLYAGLYTSTITDANNCKLIQDIVVVQPNAPLESTMPIIADTICFGAQDGVANASAIGGTAPYTYLWNGGENSAFISGRQVGIYNVTITDANACVTIDSSVITQNDQIFAWLEAEPPLCHNGSDGTMKVKNIFYGANAADPAAFTYKWNTNPPQNTQQANSLLHDSFYVVTVSDQNGCTSTQTAQVGNPEAVYSQIDTIAAVRCYGEDNGMAIVSGGGGSAPYTYLWEQNVPIQLDSLGAKLKAGNYRVTITDAKGCFTNQTVVITQPAIFDVNFQKEDNKCFGDANGKVRAVAIGGSLPYSYNWSNGATNNYLENLPAGNIFLQLNDKNGCQVSKSTEILQPNTPLIGRSTPKGAVCYNAQDGELVITGEGGTPPYKYSLDGVNWNGSTRQIGLGAGIYAPFIKDNNGCVQQLPPVEIKSRGALSVELGEDFSIELGTNTQLNAVVSNNIGPVEFIWSSEDSIWLSCMDCANPFVDSLYYQNGFELYIVDSAGCSAEDRIVVLVKKIRKVFVPSGFSPNNDTQNELLLTHGQKDVKVLEFRVYDRWGELLYQANDFDLNDPQIGWDGKFRDKEMDPGVFIWTIEVEYIDGVKEFFKGNTTLIR